MLKTFEQKYGEQTSKRFLYWWGRSVDHSLFVTLAIFLFSSVCPENSLLALPHDSDSENKRKAEELSRE